MNHHIISSLTLFFIFASFLTAAQVENVFKKDHRHFNLLDDIDVKIENDEIVLTCEYDDDSYIEITPEHELYISGEFISLNRYQRRLVGEYYNKFMEIKERAKVIGVEGAKTGLKGAKIGLLAVKGVLKMLVSDYDRQDFENEIEDKSEELEIQSDKLEELASELEDVANDFEELHDDLKNEIDELNDLSWF